MAHIEISIFDKDKRIFHWPSKEMSSFDSAVLVRAMASAIDKTVDEAQMDSAIARIVLAKGSVAKGLQRTGMSKVTYYRRLKNAK